MIGEYYFCINGEPKFYGRIFRTDYVVGTQGRGPGLIDGKIVKHCIFTVTGKKSKCRKATEEEILYAKLMGL